MIQSNTSYIDVMKKKTLWTGTHCKTEIYFVLLPSAEKLLHNTSARPVTLSSIILRTHNITKFAIIIFRKKSSKLNIKLCHSWPKKKIVGPHFQYNSWEKKSSMSFCSTALWKWTLKLQLKMTWHSRWCTPSML